MKLVNQSYQSAAWQTTDDKAQGVFTDVPYGKYDVEVSAVGYLREHKGGINVIGSTRPADVGSVLPNCRDLFDFRKHHYDRRHSFDHYMLFASTEEKRKEPPSKPSGEKRSQLSAPGFLK